MLVSRSQSSPLVKKSQLMWHGREVQDNLKGRFMMAHGNFYEQQLGGNLVLKLHASRYIQDTALIGNTNVEANWRLGCLSKAEDDIDWTGIRVFT